MLPLLNLLIVLFTSTIIRTTISQGLTLKLIPPSSPDSPFYNESLSYKERVRQCIVQSHARVSYQSNRDIEPQEVARPPVQIKQFGLHAVKIGIGTFLRDKPTYKSYFLAMDTGSSLIWLQCEDCQKEHKCFRQRDPPFPSSTSKTYRPLQCHRDPNLCGSHKCDGQFCIYGISYFDGSYSKGVIAHEKFTFNSFPQGQETKDIHFGCGLDQEKVIFAELYPENQIAGILGLGWAPDALHIQLDSETDSKFSYCLQSEHSPPHETYIRFGSDIEMTANFQKTQLNEYHSLYTVTLVGVSINGHRLPSHQKNRMILDSGACSSYLVEPVYQTLEKWLVQYFSKDRSLERREKTKDFCYDRIRPVPPGHEYNGLPTITLNFEGADFLIKPDGVFLAQTDVLRKQFFCLTIYPDKNDNLLGTYQQANHRVVFDLKKKLLHFKSENC